MVIRKTEIARFRVGSREEVVVVDNGRTRARGEGGGNGNWEWEGEERLDALYCYYRPVAMCAGIRNKGGPRTDWKKQK